VTRIRSDVNRMLDRKEGEKGTRERERKGEIEIEIEKERERENAFTIVRSRQCTRAYAKFNYA